MACTSRTAERNPRALRGGAASVFALILSACYVAVDGDGNLSAGAVVITQQPRDASVRVGAQAEFSVGAAGGGTLSFQWRRNAVDIPGATAAAYRTPAVTASDDGARLSVRVCAGAICALSNEARLTVVS